MSGSNFHAAASPLFSAPLRHVLSRVEDPIANVTLQRLWDEQNQELEGLGAGSDYVAFQDLAGTSSIDFGFGDDANEHGFPYHSCHETFEWMQKFGDPGFKYHKTLAQIWALLILEISDRPIIPFDMNNYAAAVKQYIDTLESDVASTSGKLNTTTLREAGDVFAREADRFHQFDEFWSQQVLAASGGYESTAFAIQRIEHNERASRFETDLLDIVGTGEEGPYGVSF